MSKFKEGDLVVHKTYDFGLGEVQGWGVGMSWVKFELSPAADWYHNHELELYNDWEDQAFEVVEMFDDPRDEAPTPIVDVVNSPDHYNTGKVECIDYLKDNMSWEGYTGYLEGNCKKYMHRWRHKGNPLQDLSKSRWYLNRLIEELGGDEGA